MAEVMTKIEIPEMPRPLTAHFDFDGTLIEKLNKRDWRNWFKAGIPPRDGALNFIQGMEDVGIVIGTVISRRNDLIRRGTTEHSVRELGFGRFFSPEELQLMGSETNKAAKVIEERSEGPVVMTDDYVNKLGKEILTATKKSGEVPIHPLILATAWTGERDERVSSLARSATMMGLSAERESGGSGLTIPEANMHIVSLQPFSYSGGVRLAEFAFSTL